MPDAVLTVEKAASFASSLKRDKLRKLLVTDDTPAIILLIIAMDHFGTEMLEWEPDTLSMELRDELGAVLPQVNMDKIQALMLVLTSNQFFVSLEAFIHICNVLSDHEASFTEFDPADAEEMNWALTEINLMGELENPAEQFSDEIKTYVAERLRAEGFVRPPKSLAWGELDDPETADRVDQFEDDPVFFNALWDRQQKDIEAVNAYAQSRLNRVTTLLKDLPMLVGSVKDIFKS